MRIQKGNNKKTNFNIRYSYFKYQVLCFGLFNILAGYLDYIDKILAKKIIIFIVLYLDKIQIYTDILS